jgi:hypothetical protein
MGQQPSGPGEAAQSISSGSVPNDGNDNTGKGSADQPRSACESLVFANVLDGSVAR